MQIGKKKIINFIILSIFVKKKYIQKYKTGGWYQGYKKYFLKLLVEL